MNADNILVESSGDPEKDRAQVALFVKQRGRMEDGVCPNGCAVMMIIDGVCECPSCKYVGFGYAPILPRI